MIDISKMYVVSISYKNFLKFPNAGLLGFPHFPWVSWAFSYLSTKTPTPLLLTISQLSEEILHYTCALKKKKKGYDFRGLKI